MTNILPLNGNFIVEPDPVIDQSKGGIALPDGSKEQPGSGTIVTLDPNINHIRIKEGLPPIEKGMKLHYPMYCAIPVTHGNKQYVRVKLEEANYVCFHPDRSPDRS